MSYGVVGSKSGHLLVETLTGSGGSPSDAAFERFQTVWGATWVPGRLTMTALHLTFMPNRVGRGSAMLKIDLVDITGVVLTKLDGTAKGGIVFQVQRELGVPVKLVGLGEGADDLAPFEPGAFVDALLG